MAKEPRRLEGIDKIVIGLYAHGMTVRDIQDHLVEVYDIEVSPDLISSITDAVLDEVREWQAQPLDPVCPVIFLDAIVCKVRDQGTVKNKAAHLAVGVAADGKKEVLGIRVERTEGAKFWLRVLNDLMARGIEDVLIVVCDGCPLRSRPCGPTRSCRPHPLTLGDGEMVSPVTTPPGEDLCKRVAFEARMQTCPSWWRRAA